MTGFTRSDVLDTITNQRISNRNPRREPAGIWVSCAYTGEAWNWKTPGHSTSRPPQPMPTCPKQHHKESADRLQMQRNRYTTSCPTLTADQCVQRVLAMVPHRHVGLGSESQFKRYQLVVRVGNKPKQPTQVYFDCELPTSLNWVGYQQVAQQLHR